MLRTSALVAIIGISGCMISDRPAAIQPHPSLRAGSLEERESLYKQYRLDTLDKTGGTWFVRGDGKHTYMDLRETLGQYPRSRALYNRVADRDDALANLALWGLAIGITGGIDQLAAIGGEDRMTQTGRNVMYGLGGALLISAGIAALSWHNPIKELAATYNEELRADLALPDAPSRGTTATALRF